MGATEENARLFNSGQPIEVQTLRLGPFTPVPPWRPQLKSCPLEGQFVLEKPVVEALLLSNEMQLDDLLQALVAPAAELALPYLSGFFVGAAALGTSGRIFFGCNMEFPGASLASSVHAEQCLTANLLRHKESEIITVAISAPPCGHCRQFFSEMACVVSYWIDMIARPDLLQRPLYFEAQAGINVGPYSIPYAQETMRIIFGEGPNNVYGIEDILPHRFGPQDLLDDESHPLLLQPQTHNLTLTSDAVKLFEACQDIDISKEAYQEAVEAALNVAQGSYTPYTKCPAAVALLSPKGLHCGSIVENAAHNPTLQPLQAAFINARIDGLTQYSEVKGAILVELQHAPLQQALAAEALLKKVAPHAFFHVLYSR